MARGGSADGADQVLSAYSRAGSVVSPRVPGDAHSDGPPDELVGEYSVEVRDSHGVQVGAGNTQINYVYHGLTWADGISPAPLVSVSGVIDSPYRGLAAFDEQDAGFFFGRDAAAEQLLERMSRMASGGAGLLVVSGVSGAGKSSLVRAGVIPRIRGTGLASAPGAADWPALVLTPTRTPLDELALRVAMLGHADASTARRWAASDPAAFALTVRQAALTAAASRPAIPAQPTSSAQAAGSRGQADSRLLLVVDQFEQVFTQCADEGERTAFIAALHAAATVAQGAGQVPAALVVLCVRADFEARCADYPQLADAIQDRYLVTAMTERQLRLAITGPARQAGAEVDDDLADVLLAEVRGRQPGASGAGVLPLLSHALDQAWRSRAGTGLKLADYERTGGIERAVADSAQRAYDGLTPGQQAAARQVFIALTAAGSDNVDTAQRVTRGELTDGRDPARAGDVEGVLEAFAAERLLILAADSVEISHEVLLTAWPLLRDTWLAQTHADRVVRTRLRAVAGEWASTTPRDSSYLYKGTLLAAAGEAAARAGDGPARNPPLSPNEQEFLAASDRAVLVQGRRRRALLGVLATLTVVAVILGGVAVASAVNATRQAGIATQQAALATRQHAVALSRQLAAEALSASSTNPVTARRLAVAAWQASPTSQAADAMAALLAEQQQKGFLPGAPSPARDSVLPSSTQESVVAFSPDGTLLAAGDADGGVRVWSAVTGQPLGVPVQTNLAQANHVAVLGLAFSPDGKLLASGGGDGKLRAWDPATGRVAFGPVLPDARRPDVAVDVVAFSPDGTLLAAGCNDGNVRLWSTASGSLAGPPVRTLPGRYANAVIAIAFSPDGGLLAAGGNEGTVRLWNPRTGRPVTGLLAAEPNGSTKFVNAVAFSPDGRLLASLGFAGSLRLWDAATGRRVAGFQTQGPAGSTGGMAFSPDGALLATADGDGLVRTWDPLAGRLIGEPLRIDATVSSFVNGVAFSPHGHLLAGAAGDGTVRLWDTATRRPAGAPLAVDGNDVPVIFTVAFGPRDGLLAAIGSDGLARLWDTATRRQAGSPLPAGDTGLFGAVAFSPDGKRLAVGGAAFSAGDGTVRVWDLAAGRPGGQPRLARLAGNADSVSAVAFGPDGTMAAAGAVPQLSLWDPDGHRRVIQAGGPAWKVAFSPDGKRLAIADEDGTLRLWDPATGQPAGPRFRVAPKDSAVNALTFSPDGTKLATSDGAGTVALWDPAAARRVRGPLPTGAVKLIGVGALAFSPDGRLLAGVGSDGLARLWDPATGSQVSGLLQAVGTGHNARAVAFSPDGKSLATAGTDGMIRLWNVQTITHPYQALCADVGIPTSQEWTRYAPGEPRPTACSRK
jgi:WD40 repeat protein